MSDSHMDNDAHCPGVVGCVIKFTGVYNIIVIADFLHGDMIREWDMQDAMAALQLYRL